MSTQISIEITAEKPDRSGFYSTMLDLPASKMQIQDAKERARYSDRPKRFQDIRIEESAGISLDNVRTDTTSIEELNFLAERMDSLSHEEMIGFEALTEKLFSGMDEEELVSVKDLINMTYHLDTLIIIPEVSDLESLGRFAAENGFIEDLQGLPDSALKYLDYEAIGQEQLDNDEGVFVDGHYVVTVDYEPTEVYDGKHISEILKPEKYELIEIIGRPALFSDGRIPGEAVPDGLYCYDLRSGNEDLTDGTIEPTVIVDHSGSILVKEPIVFGEQGFIQLDEDSSPNFTGIEMTAEEFATQDNLLLDEPDEGENSEEGPVLS